VVIHRDNDRGRFTLYIQAGRLDAMVPSAAAVEEKNRRWNWQHSWISDTVIAITMAGAGSSTEDGAVDAKRVDWRAP
jgi:hypothetical protein